MEEVLDFIDRRFKTDCNWLTGNCYFFCMILLSRFPSGRVYYDTIYGHFVFYLDGEYYDWGGIVYPKGVLIPWDKFKEYDAAQYKVIVRDCIK